MFDVVLEYARSIGVQVHTSVMAPFRVSQFQANFGAHDFRFLIQGRANADNVWMEWAPGAEENCRTWTLLHELGHVEQWRRGLIDRHLVSEVYGWNICARTIAIEEDATRRGRDIAAQLGISQSPLSEEMERLALESYKRAAGMAA